MFVYDTVFDYAYQQLQNVTHMINGTPHVVQQLVTVNVTKQVLVLSTTTTTTTTHFDVATSEIVYPSKPA